MTSMAAVGIFLKHVEQSRLLPADRLQAVIREYRLDQQASPRHAAKILLENRLITPFQVERLLAGRYSGIVLDHYRIREILGTGGMGQSYIAEDTQSGEKVAMKVLAPKYRNVPGMTLRMRLEAAAGTGIIHPNVVRTYSLKESARATYLVMKLVRGVTLHELIVENGPVPWPLASDFIRQAALGLQAAHEQGVIHRDIKPANLLVDNSGHTWISDFGLALVRDYLEDEFALSMLYGHNCVGTPDFIAPEQSVGQFNVRPTADIYSLGCTLYSALSGKLPFPVRCPKEKMEAHRRQRPRPLSEVAPGVPEDIACIVRRMMGKRPQYRFQSAAEVAAALQPFSRPGRVNFDFRAIIAMRAKRVRLKDSRPAAAKERFPVAARHGLPVRQAVLPAENKTFPVDTITPARQA